MSTNRISAVFSKLALRPSTLLPRPRFLSTLPLEETVPGAVKRTAGLLSRADDGEPHDEQPHDAPANKESSTSSPSGKRDAYGNPFWPLVGRRGIVVSQAEDLTFIGIRAFQDRSGQGKKYPSKKGISLSPQQWFALVEHIPDINKYLASQGVDANTRPVAKSATPGDEPSKPARTQKPSNPKTKTANPEATSKKEEDGDADQA